ncbi:MAG: glycosyltransferase [Coriobacteriia bacterium]|nr:glycosyltransferase [Coriobacteriia bacterium]
MTTRDIVFTGQGRWAALLAEGLRDHAGLQVTVAPLDRVTDALRSSVWLALARANVVVRIGFRPGARTWRGRLADAALRAARQLHPGQKTAYYWIGTDVQGLTRDAEADVWPRWLQRELAAARHGAVAQRLVDELAQVGVDADLLPHPPMNRATGTGVAPLPAQFSVLTYIPDARPEFYGAPAVFEAARQLPDVHFRVLGGTGSGVTPSNIEFLGWQEDPARWFVESSCLVRMVEHDGCGGTVLEALSYGRPVIYSYDQEGVIFVPFGDTDALVKELRALCERHVTGELLANEVIAASTRERYSPERCYPRLAEWLRSAAAEGAA